MTWRHLVKAERHTGPRPPEVPKIDRRRASRRGRARAVRRGDWTSTGLFEVPLHAPGRPSPWEHGLSVVFAGLRAGVAGRMRLLSSPARSVCCLESFLSSVFTFASSVTIKSEFRTFAELSSP